jgi:large subunit ribosomal protein L10
MEDKDFPNFKLGLVDGKVMEASELEQLAKLPSKEVLISMILQGFNAPVTGFVGVLNDILRKFVYAINAIAKIQEEKN